MINYRTSLVVFAGLPLYLVTALFAPVYAACEPAGTPSDDTIICTNVDTLGVDALGGDDQVYVESGAEVMILTSEVDSYFDHDANVLGDAHALAEMTRVANTMAISMGAGTSTVTIDGIIRATSITGVTTRALAEAALGSAAATSRANSYSTAFGLDVGDTGNVTISAEGDIEASATATADARAVTFAIGSGEPDAYSVASAKATGLYSDAGPISLINNGGSIHATATAEALSYSASENYSAILPTADTYSDKNASADARGIKFGDEDNEISNHGVINVSATAKGPFFPGLLADSDSLAAAWWTIGVPVPIPLPANAYATTWTNSQALALGIEVGQGRNLIENYGTLNVSAEVTAEASAFAQVLSIPIYWEAESHVEGNASAWGISTGSGDNIVKNYGVINATATVSTDAIAIAFTHDTSEIKDAEAIGIWTRYGNDMVANFGSITANTTINGTTHSGIGIFTSGGDDTVILGDASLVSGSVILGDGNDVFQPLGTPVVTSTIDGEDGNDLIDMDGNGSLSATLQNFEIASKQGTGTYTLSSLPSMQTLTVSEGTLDLGSPYTFMSGGGYHATIDTGDRASRLQVNGLATLNGSLDVLTSSGFYHNGSLYPIVSATGGIAGAFDTVSLPSPTPLLSFSLEQKPMELDVVASAQPFTTVAKNRVEWAVGNYLDAITPATTGDLWNVLGEFQQLSESEFESAFSSLSPDSYDNATLTSYRVSRAYTRGIQQRLSTRRLLDLAIGNGETQSLQHQAPVLLASNDAGNNMEGLLQRASDSGRRSLYGLWLDTYGLWGDQDDRNRHNWNHGGYTGFDFNVHGITLGYDHTVTDRMVAGLSVGYANTDIDLDNNAGDGDIDSVMVSVYGEYQGEHAYLDAVLTYGRNDYDNKRNLKIGSIRRTARSDHDGTLFSAYLEGGRPINRDHWQLEPFISLQYVHLDEDSFRESGAGDVNLKIDDNRTESLVSEAGIRAAHTAQKKSGKLITDMGVAWVHDFNIDDRVITTSYAGAPSTAFSIKGRDIERNGVALDLGLTFQNKDNLTTSVRLGAEIRDNYYDKGIMGQIRYEF